MVIRKLTNKEILSLPRLYNSRLSSWAIAKKFNTYHSNILYHLKKLNIKRRDKSSAAKEGVIAGRIIIKKHKIPKNLKLNEDLSYILGVIAGDGCISYDANRQRYQICLGVIDKDFIDEFRKKLYNFFNLKPTEEFRKSKNKNWNDQYVTRLCSKEACDFINSIGNFKKDKWRIPEIIKNSNMFVKEAFLKGFFDSEGEIDKKSGRVGAVSMNFVGLNDISDLLRDLGVKYTIIKKKDSRPNTNQKYVLRIHDKKSINLFYKKIGFTIKRKQNILKEVLFKNNLIFPRDRDRLVP